jgi:hypothetical protein
MMGNWYRREISWSGGGRRREERRRLRRDGSGAELRSKLVRLSSKGRSVGTVGKSASEAKEMLVRGR